MSNQLFSTNGLAEQGATNYELRTTNHNYFSSYCSLLFSLLIHAFLFLLFGATLLHLRHHEEKKSPIATPPEIVFDLSPLSQERPVVDTTSTHPLDKAPEHAAFQSYENTAAASELPPTGKAPLPTQQGREEDTLSFRQADHSVGEQTQPPSTVSPTLTSPQEIHSDDKALSSVKAAEAVAVPAPDQPVMGHLSSAAKNNEETSRTSMIRGSISNKGSACVAAEATPLGRYKKTLSEAISSRWRYYVDHRMELLSFGTATISFYVTQEGKIETLNLLTNSSNQSFADCCLKSIMEAKLPAIPPEIATTLQGKKLDVEYRFTICSD